MIQGQDAEHQLLERYASVANSKIISSQSDLDPKDRAMPEMLGWCRRQKSLVVLNSGTILSSNPSSRLVQNCKVVMLNKGLVPGEVFPATFALVTMLLENADEAKSSGVEAIAVSVSSQQQRLRLLVKEALNVEASDIHVEVRQHEAKIRFRKHGELFLHAEWLPRLAKEIISVAFNKETDHAISHFNPSVPQSASMPLDIEGRHVRLRLASLPAHGGFDVVMRILPSEDEEVHPLASLGYTKFQTAMLKKALHVPAGAVIVAGPTGSGKTTTLASCMQLVDSKRKIFTIEDPVEKLVSTATQVPVNTEHYDRSFANMTRTVLRMDPDVIVLGEMRDEDTAQMMVRAAITGHLVFSTLHTNSALDIITRLIDLGVSRTMLSHPNLLACLVCQRLLPKLCQHCAKPIAGSALHESLMNDLFEALQQRIDRVRVRGHDCQHCHGLGISGRTVVAEMIWLDEPGQAFIQRQDMVGWRRYLLEHGWESYRVPVMRLVREGKVDPLDALRVIGDFSLQTEPAEFNYRVSTAV